MKKAIKKITAGFMSVVLVITTLFALGINIASAATSGQCTSTINWSYNAATKTLTLTGTGAMPDYRATNIGTNKKSPWESEKIGDNTIKVLMENLVVGEGITEIGEYNFFKCTALKSVSLPSTLKSIDGMGLGTDLGSASYGAFQECESLTEIALPEGLETIEPFAFKKCTSLKSVIIPNSLKTLGNCAFLGCSALETVTFGTGLTNIDSYTFASCGVKRIYWGSITDISDNAFLGCNIKDLDLPQQIKSIGSRAFANNTSLMNVTVNNQSMEFKGTNSKTSNNFSGSNQTVKIYGHSASTAQSFAESYGYTFVSIDDCDHTDTRTETIVEPTCTEAGIQQVICNECGFIVTESSIDALGHDFKLSAEFDSTELDGHIYRDYICTRCDATDETVEHAMENSIYHVWVEGYYEISYITEPTCTSGGIATYTCTVDGCVNALGRPTSDRMIITSGHKVEYWVETPATCTEEGKKEGTCTVCGEKVTQTIPAKNHSYDESDLAETVENEEDGHTHYYFRCKNCAQLIEETTHNEWVEGYYSTRMLTNATCTISGLARDTCDICGETRSRIVKATGEHDYEEISRTEPTCTTRGNVKYKCKNCDFERTEYLSATGHDYVLDESLSYDATCTDSGRSVYNCSVCGASKSETVPAKGHTPVEETYVITKEPTCTKTGMAAAQCSVCGEMYEEIVEALGHDYEDVETDLTSDGKPGHVLAIPTCKRCGATDTGKVIHKEWIEGYYTTSGTDVETCETTYVTDSCSVAGCDEIRVTKNEGVGHEYYFVSQSYEGVTLICRHCMTTVVVPAQTLMDYWEEYNCINAKPHRTATDNTGYLDLDQNGIINAKDYARIVNLCRKEPELIAEHEQALTERYGRARLGAGELSAGTDAGVTINIENGSKVYDITFTPTESGTYNIYSSYATITTDVVDPFAFLEVGLNATEWEKYDDNSGTLTNFRIEYECEAGVTYHIVTGVANPESTGTYKVYAVKQETEDSEGENETGEGEGSGTGSGIIDIISPYLPINNG